VIGRRLFQRLAPDNTGTTLVEFALISPLLIVLLGGVLQVGLMLQNYNAVRHVSADVSRYAMVQFATSNNKLTNDDLTNYATSVAQSAPYLLNGTMAIRIADEATPAVTGLTEKTLTITYQIPSVLSTMGLSGPVITYTQPLFLTTGT